MNLAVVVTTYEWPDALDAVLRALSEQSDPDFEVVVADDGSDSPTADVVGRWQERFGDRLAHVWQPDEGYRLARARNFGALKARGDYLVFLDGDCLPQRHFVQAMKESARPGWFVGGRRIMLSSALTARILGDDLEAHRWSRLRWLLGQRRHAKGLRALTPRDRRKVGTTQLPDFEPPDRAYGPGLGVSRSDLELVNGWDTRFVGWGEEDVDLAVRLQRSGLRCGHAGSRAASLHLWHPTRMTSERPNWPLLEETQRSERIEAVEGLRELALGLGLVLDAKPRRKPYRLSPRDAASSSQRMRRRLGATARTVVSGPKRAGRTDGGTALAHPLAIAEHPSPGVNLVGFLQGELGLGEVARKLSAAVERADVPLASIAYTRTPSRQEHPLERRSSDEAPYDTNIICVNADYLHTLLQDIGVRFFTGRYSIGVWFWETNIFRRENLGGFRFLDEVWVASEYVRRAVSARSDIPVLVVPLPVEKPSRPVLSRSDVGLPPEFTFLFTFDFVSAQRKNPTAVVEAFKQAFAPGEGPVLVLKSINGQERKSRWLQELVDAARGRPDIHIRDGYVSAEQKDAMVASCDCYVSLHRSEGFGLGMAEAMSYGKPVIATGYSGNLEFMDESNSYLVPHRLTAVPSDWWAYSPGAEWADPDVDAAGQLMRRVYEDQDAARALGERARDEILHRFSVDRTADFIAGRLEIARARRAADARSSALDTRTPILQASQALAKGVGGSLAEGASRRAPTSVARRLLLRALWPYLESQHRFDSAVVDSLAALRRSYEKSRPMAD